MSKITSLYSLAFLVLFFSFPAPAQVNVMRVDNPSAFEAKEGTFYYLPGTYLQIEVCYDLIEKFRGPYADYAFKFLGLDSVIKVNERVYELKEVQCRNHTGIDPQQLFFVEFLQKQSKDPLALHMILSEQGYLSEAALGMEIPVPLAEGEVEGLREGATFQHGIHDIPFRYYATDNQVVKIDTIIKMVTIDTSTFKDVSYKRSMVYRTMEERASEAAEFIATIRENRFKLLTGYQEVNYDKETLEYMDSKLLEMEDSYLSLFKGLCRHESYKVTVTYFPLSENTGQDEVILRLSSYEGLKQSADQLGDPILIRIDPKDTSVVFSSPGSTSPSAAGPGFVFRTPQLCRVTISWKGKNFVAQDLRIHQLGIFSHYPVTSKLHIQLHPSDGSMQRVSVQ